MNLIGDFWHRNPKYYADDYFAMNKSSSDIWEYDEYKAKIAKENGFKLLTIWESDFKEDRDKVIKICMNFLQE